MALLAQWRLEDAQTFGQCWCQAVHVWMWKNWFHSLQMESCTQWWILAGPNELPAPCCVPLRVWKLRVCRVGDSPLFPRASSLGWLNGLKPCRKPCWFVVAHNLFGGSIRFSFNISPLGCIAVPLKIFPDHEQLGASTNTKQRFGWWACSTSWDSENTGEKYVGHYNFTRLGISIIWPRNKNELYIYWHLGTC